jgi:hypothetical protein
MPVLNGGKLIIPARNANTFMAQRMPKEIHYILFSKEELHVALVQFQRARAEKLPTGGIPTLELSTGPEGPVAKMTIAGIGENASTQSFEFGQDQLLGAITLFCKAQRIPLAVRAEKRIEVVGDRLALLATLNAERGAPEKQDGTIRYTDQEIEAGRKTLKE